MRRGLGATRTHGGNQEHARDDLGAVQDLNGVPPLDGHQLGCDVEGNAGGAHLLQAQRRFYLGPGIVARVAAQPELRFEIILLVPPLKAPEGYARSVRKRCGREHLIGGRRRKCAPDLFTHWGIVSFSKWGYTVPKRYFVGSIPGQRFARHPGMGPVHRAVAGIVLVDVDADAPATDEAVLTVAVLRAAAAIVAALLRAGLGAGHWRFLLALVFREGASVAVFVPVDAEVPPASGTFDLCEHRIYYSNKNRSSHVDHLRSATNAVQA